MDDSHSVPIPLPAHSQFSADLAGILTTARDPLFAGKEWDAIGAALQKRITGLADRMALDLYFEHMPREALTDTIFGAWKTYRDVTPRPNARTFARKVLDEATGYPQYFSITLGVQGINMPSGTTIGDASFVKAHDFDFSNLAVPSETSAWFRRMLRGGMVCQVRSPAGTPELALTRAQQAAETALALIRQAAMHDLRWYLHPSQRHFGLDGAYLVVAEQRGLVGWTRDPDLDSLDLSDESKWQTKVSELSSLRGQLSAELRDRVDTALEWLDIAALTATWRVAIPSIFAAIESLLVPETRGRKSGIVTIRSVAMQFGVKAGVFHPGVIQQAYELRNQLIHGGVTLRREEGRLTRERQMWAYMVLQDYLRFVQINSLTSVRQVAAHIDRLVDQPLLDQIRQFGLQDAIDEYLEAVKT